MSETSSSTNVNAVTLKVCTVEKVSRKHFYCVVRENIDKRAGEPIRGIAFVIQPSVGAIKYLRSFDVGDFVLCAFVGGAVNSPAYIAGQQWGEMTFRGLELDAETAEALQREFTEESYIGFVLGGLYGADKPEPCGDDHEIRFGESKITLKPEGELIIDCKQDISIDGKTIQLNR